MDMSRQKQAIKDDFNREIARAEARRAARLEALVWIESKLEPPLYAPVVSELPEETQRPVRGDNADTDAEPASTPPIRTVPNPASAAFSGHKQRDDNDL